ncbi:hypothetical protein EBU71_14655 [bacterium]|nr:hypothetical protein [Candidatus Elulimicrobium humile]
MNIAYLFHGHSRTWNQCYQSFFEKVFNHNPGDIYIHTWDKVNARAGSWWNGYGHLRGTNLEISLQDADVSGIYAAYRPKKMIVEQHPQPDITEYNFPAHLADQAPAIVGIKCMLKSRRTVFEEAMKEKTYDRLFSLRMDIEFLNNIDPEEFNQDFLFRPNKLDNIDLWNQGAPAGIDILSKYYYNIETHWFKNESIHNPFYEMRLSSFLGENGIHIDHPGFAHVNGGGPKTIAMKESTLEAKMVRPF